MTVLDQVARLASRPEASSANLRWERHYVDLLLATDALVGAVVGCVSYLLRFGAPPSEQPGYAALSLAFPLIWLLSLYLARAYQSRFLYSGAEEYHRIMSTAAVMLATIALISYVGHLNLARGYVLTLVPSVTVLGLFGRYAARRYLHRLRANGRCMRRVVVVGYERAVANLCRRLSDEPYHGMKVVGAAIPGHRPWVDRIDDVGVPVLGTFAEAAEAARVARADTVAVLACPEWDGEALRRLAWSLETSQIGLMVAPVLMEVAGPRTTIRPVASLPLLNVEHPQLSGGSRLVKTTFDVVIALLSLLLLSPVLLAIALAIRLGDGGPALFLQERVGKDGKVFRLLKFRSMRPDAEDQLAQLLAMNEQNGVMFKIRRDPRITPVGAFLRRYSLDELPQLINVLLGDMSLVGPRPPLPREVELYEPHVHRRLVVKPGITGLWQVSGRADLTWDEAVRLDLRYVENWSLAYDMAILRRTFAAVIKASGAY